MSDDLGTKQNRVIEVDGRALDNVVFLTGRPPLSSEWNLINQVANNKIQDATKLSVPSGWMRVGEVSGTVSESDAQSGDALTSESYEANTFKVVSKGGNVAVVNGWKVLVQGWNSPDDNNVVELDTAAGQRYDFVFLEVWRKLVAYNESLYPYGNISKTPYTDNEILWPAVGTETSMRVQIQYRVRSKAISTILSGDSDVFGDVDIHPIGGRTLGEYVYNSFEPCDADDIGLYKAGDGSEDSQENLGTVDGYVYAIPMFLVYRRSPSASVFSPTTINSSYTTAAYNVAGVVKDRPDGRLADCVYSQDIVDFRHLVATSISDVMSTVDRTVAKLVSGDLTTAMKFGYDQNGQQSMAVSGGSVLTKAERINSTGSDNIPNMGTGDSFRRAFCNAGLSTDHCIKEVSFNGSGQWAAGTIAVSSIILKTYGSVESVNGVYSSDLGALVTGVSFSPSSIIISGSSNLVGQSCNLFIEFTFSYDSSDAGFKDVPRTMLEASKGTFTPISLGSEVNVRFNNTGALLDFGLTPNVGVTTVNDHVISRGGGYTENYNFGHDLVVYRTMSGATVNEALTNGTLNGYYILGVKRVRVKSGAVYGNPVDFTASRTVTVGPPYVINNYIIAPTATSNSEVEITFITGSKPSDDELSAYDLAGSMKFFDVSRQGRGVTDTYEMIDVVAVEGSTPGEYILDTTTIGKPIVAVGTRTYMSGGYEVGTPIAFRHDNGDTVIITTASPNDSLPVLEGIDYLPEWLPTRIVLTSSTTGAGLIRVPVLVHAAPTAAETPYTFFYEMAPYQGILSATTEYRGKMIAEGDSFVTSLGSGEIKDYTYSEGTASFLQGSRVVVGVGTLWSTYVSAGDYIRVTGGLYYRILSVTDDTHIVLSELFVEDDEPSSGYEILRWDTPESGISNVIDRMPSYMVSDSTGTYAVDYTCTSELLDSFFGLSALLNGAPVIKSHDPLVSKVNDFIVGVQTKTNIRGRYDFILSSVASPAYRLKPESPRAHIGYSSLGTSPTGRRKVFQAYLFARSASGFVTGSKDMTGRLYLMVISGETCSGMSNLLTTFSSVDTVDLFELVGRPVIKAP